MVCGRCYKIIWGACLKKSFSQMTSTAKSIERMKGSECLGLLTEIKIFKILSQLFQKIFSNPVQASLQSKFFGVI